MLIGPQAARVVVWPGDTIFRLLRGQRVGAWDIGPQDPCCLATGMWDIPRIAPPRTCARLLLHLPNVPMPYFAARSRPIRAEGGGGAGDVQLHSISPTAQPGGHGPNSIDGRMRSVGSTITAKVVGTV